MGIGAQRGEPAAPADRQAAGEPSPATAHAVSAYLPHDRTDEVALCLSGGGFRAALFHLGALRRLFELGVLPNIDTVSCVSGGSILAAHLLVSVPDWSTQGLARLDWERDVAQPFRQFTGRNLRTAPLLRYLRPPWNLARPQVVVEALAAGYEQGLGLHQRTLHDLPDRPKYLFCATDMTFGDHWVFEKSGVGDDEAGYLQPAPAWPLARAVAASSCFPPVFGPVFLTFDQRYPAPGSYRRADRQWLLGNLHLTDGGVVDNLGVEKVWQHAGDLLVSDGGASFQFGWNRRLLWRFLRYTAIAGSQGTAVRKRWIISNLLSGQMNGAYWGIDSVAAHYDAGGAAAAPDQSYAQELVADVIARVRTDLDAFSPAECAVLENHGYILAEAASRAHARHLMGRPDAPFVIPHPRWMDEQAVWGELKDSSRRTQLGRGFLPWG